MNKIKNDKSYSFRDSRGRKDHLLEQSNIDEKIKVLSEIENENISLVVKLNPNGSYMGAGLINGIVNIINCKNDNLMYTLKPDEEDNGSGSIGNNLIKTHSSPPVISIKFVPWIKFNQNSVCLVAYSNGKIKTFHFLQEKIINSIEEDNEILCMEYSPNGDTFTTSGGDGVLRIYDSETQTILHSFTPKILENANYKRIYSIVYHPLNNNELITGGWNNIVTYYDLREKLQTRTFYGPKIIGNGLDLSSDGKTICSASYRKHDQIQLWDYQSGKLMSTFKNYEKCLVSTEENFITNNCNSLKSKKLKIPSSMLYSVKFYNKDYIVVGGTEENSLAIINTSTERVYSAIRNIKRSVYDLDTFENKICIVAGKEIALLDVIF